jgi:hypothetical protein
MSCVCAVATVSVLFILDIKCTERVFNITFMSSPVICRNVHNLFTLFVFLRIVVSNTYFAVFLLCLSSLRFSFLQGYMTLSLSYVGPKVFFPSGICDLKPIICRILSFLSFSDM